MKKFFSKLLKSKRLWIAVLAVATTGVIGSILNQSNAAGCPTNDIMPCGASSRTEFISKLKRNNPSDMDNIYANSRYDLPKSEYERFANEARKGKINPDSGNITVDGVTVGLDAQSIGRNAKSVSHPITIDGKTYHESPIRLLTKYTNDAMVLFDEKGNVQTVVMNICGNPMTVTPKNPKYKCDLLNMKQIDRDTYTFSSKISTSNGATVTKVVYDFGDGTTSTQTSPSTVVTHDYTGTGTFVAKVTAYVKTPFSKNAFPITVTPECKTTITVTELPTPKIEVNKKVDGVEHKTVGVNTEFTYQINVKNTGNIDLADVVVSDKAPSGVTFLSASAGTITNGEWKVTISPLKKGESRDYTITAKVPTLLAGTIKNTVCVDTPTIPGGPDDCDDATVDVPGVDINKLVNGKEEIDTKVGEEFTYSLVVKNTGGVLLKNVIVTDDAPENVQFIRTDKGTVVSNKLNYVIPELPVGQSVQINIVAKVTKFVANKIKNTACVDATEVPGTPDDCDDAYVKVPEPLYTCDNLTVTRGISRTDFTFETTYTVKNATYVKTVYIVRNSNGTEIARTENSSYSQTTAGNYTVEAQVVVTVDGVEKIATSANCKKPFEVTDLPVIKYTCDELSVRTIGRTQFEFKVTRTVENATYVKTVFTIRKEDGAQLARVDDADGILAYTQEAVGKYTVEAQVVVTVDGVEKIATSANCKKPFEVTDIPVEMVEVCDAATGKIITVSKADETKYEPKNSEKCKPVEVCVIAGKTIRTISREEYLKNQSLYADKNSEYCKELPKILPSTGPEAIIGGLVSSGAIGYSLYAYTASRRALKNALK